MEKMTKKDIDKLAREIMDFLTRQNLDEDVFIFYNGKRMWHKYGHDEFHCRIGKPELVIEDGFCPFDYFTYGNHQHILSMSFEGSLYETINYGGRGFGGFDKILTEHGLYYELGDSWNLSLYPFDDSQYPQIEYTDYTDMVKPDPIYIYDPDRQTEIPPALQSIMREWHRLSSETGDRGSCVIGAGFTFSYDGAEYRMAPQSPYQGSLSWETHIGTIKGMLVKAGAGSIHYNYGVLD